MPDFSIDLLVSPGVVRGVGPSRFWDFHFAHGMSFEFWISILLTG